MGFLLVVAWGKHTACGRLLPVESRLLTMGPDVHLLTVDITQMNVRHTG